MVTGKWEELQNVLVLRSGMTQLSGLSCKQETTASWLNWANMSGPAVLSWLLFTKRLPFESQGLFLCVLPASFHYTGHLAFYFLAVFQSYVTSLVRSRLIVVIKMILIMKGDHVIPRGWMLFFRVVLVGC